MSDRAAVLAALIVAAAAALAPPVPWPVALGLVVVAVCLRRPPLLVLALALLVGARANQQLAALAAPLPERIQGTVELVDDPRAQQFGTQVVVRFQGRRYLAQVPAELAAPLRDAGTGDHAVVSGRPVPLEGAPVGWVRSRHLAGRLSVATLDRGPPPAPWYAAANAVRRTLAAGSSSFDEDRRPLYLGMVMGDDRELSEVRQFRFRAAGLSHLTAVSGQNVAFVIAVAAPGLARLGRRSRAVATLGLLVGVVLVTRADPSVLRASVMAALAVVAVATGRVAPAVRVLAATVTVLLLVDPLLVHALGFRLSVAATAGLVLLTGPIESRLPAPSWVRLPLAVTLAAQVATAPLLLGLNGGLSPAAVPANLLAVPAAGMVMMLGVSVGMVAGLVTEPIAVVLQVPSRLLVGWIDVVARVATGVPCATLGPLRLVLLIVVAATWAAVRSRVDRRPARAASAVAVVLGLALCWPPPLSDGVLDPVDGVTLAVGACRGVLVHLSGAADEADTLAALHRAGVRRIDVLVVGAGRGGRRSAAAVGEQWPVRRRVEAEDGASAGVTVGGVMASVQGDAVTIELSRAACRLAP